MISAESPPAVVDPKRAAESNLGWILGVVTAVHAVAIIVAGLRSYVRIKIIKSLGRDDWTMVAATVCPEVSYKPPCVVEEDVLLVNSADLGPEKSER